MGAIITLTTDFGLADGYVAAMKGVILGINPNARLVDISHDIKPQSIAEGAFVLGTTYRYFPAGTVHLAVVDPGVGTDRRAIILKAAGFFFVAPDNGLLADVLHDVLPDSTGRLEAGWEVVAITNSRYWRSPVSPTFHGRDIFAPVAAHLSLGTRLTEFGELVSSIVVPPLARPWPRADGSLAGSIVHVDHFGNLITNVREAQMPGRAVAVQVAGRKITGLRHTYAEGEGLIALIGSSGFLEIAVNGGSAHELTGAGVGDEVIVAARTRAKTRLLV